MSRPPAGSAERARTISVRPSSAQASALAPTTFVAIVLSSLRRRSSVFTTVAAVGSRLALSRYATALPSGRTAGRRGCSAPNVSCVALAVAQGESPELELARALAGEHHRIAVGPEARIEVDEHVVREPVRVAAVREPQIAQRRENRAPAVGRSCEAVDAERRARRRVVERRKIGRRCRDLDRGCREEMHGLARRRRNASPPELPVRRVDELGRGPPGGARGEEVLTAGQRLQHARLAEHEQLEPARLRRILLPEDEHAAAGPPRRRRQPARARVHDVDRAVAAEHADRPLAAAGEHVRHEPVLGDGGIRRSAGLFGQLGLDTVRRA